MSFSLRVVLCWLIIGGGMAALGGDVIDWLKQPEAPQPAPQNEPERDPVTDEARPVDSGAGEATKAAPELETPAVTGELHRIYVIPIEGPISKPVKYILRRGLKEAIEQNVDTVILDMNTPGGRVDVMLEMVEMLDRFEGQTITFINPDAVSAGAYISMVTDSIYMSPRGVIGAAAAVAGTGQEIPETMQAKIESYLGAKMRSYSAEHRYRPELMRAMAELDYELEIDGKVIKEAGELLSLTAEEAAELYGKPAQPLLAHGIVEDLDTLIAQHFGEQQTERVTFAVTWSEHLAKYLDMIAPVLIGLGMLGLMIEFKTPGFGAMGMAGITFLLVVFLGNYVAGLAGYEAILLLLLGIIFIALELLLLPGTMVFLLLGILSVLGAILWSMTDIWPTSTGGWDVDWASIGSAFVDLGIGLVIAVLGLLVIIRYLPKNPLFGRFIRHEVVASPMTAAMGGSPLSVESNREAETANRLPPQGTEGRVVRDLRPTGMVEIAGQRYEAYAQFGMISRGSTVKVVGYKYGGLVVEKVG